MNTPLSPDQDFVDEECEESERLSPLNATGGFSSTQQLSPAQSQRDAETNLDTYDENTGLTGSFYVE